MPGQRWFLFWPRTNGPSQQARPTLVHYEEFFFQDSAFTYNTIHFHTIDKSFQTCPCPSSLGFAPSVPPIF